MTRTQKRIFALLLLMAAAAFFLWAWPNSRGTENMAMVQMFQPDEAAPLPYVLKMIAPADSLVKALRSFVFYDYYFYGFPYFSLSGLALLPLRWLGRLGNMPLVILVLRQVVSALPTLTALLLLVYMQDRFRTYRSPVLFGFLLLVPAILWNDLWWHPDGLVLLLMTLCIYFLQCDNLRFGWNFLFSAALAGAATAAKLIGVYFFLAVGLTLALGLVRKVPLKRLIGMALAYLAVMAVAFVAANPFLLSHWGRSAYAAITEREMHLITEGYGVMYEIGLKAAWPTIQQYYGGAFLILTALGAAAWGAWRGPQRLLDGLILAWFVPISITIQTITHFKFQYWLPAIIPLISCLAVLLPEKFTRPKRWQDFLRYALLLGLLVQAGLFVRSDVRDFTTYLHRADNNERIQFYDRAVETLQPLPADNLRVYYDYRLYVPGEPDWEIVNSYDLLDYDYIQQNQFGVLLLLQQRINDYLQPGMTGIDPQEFERNQQFYRDADNGTISGYRLAYRDAVGLIFVREDLYAQFMGK